MFTSSVWFIPGQNSTCIQNVPRKYDFRSHKFRCISSATIVISLILNLILTLNLQSQLTAYQLIELLQVNKCNQISDYLAISDLNSVNLEWDSQVFSSLRSPNLSWGRKTKSLHFWQVPRWCCWSQGPCFESYWPKFTDLGDFNSLLVSFHTVNRLPWAFYLLKWQENNCQWGRKECLTYLDSGMQQGSNMGLQNLTNISEL